MIGGGEVAALALPSLDCSNTRRAQHALARMGGRSMPRPWCTGVLLALAVSTAPAAAAEYRMLTSWDKSNPAVPLLAEGFAKNVEAASKGNIKFVLSGPETVPGFEQLQPVAAGAFHMLFTHGIYHYGTTGLSVGLDAVRGSIEE